MNKPLAQQILDVLETPTLSEKQLDDLVGFVERYANGYKAGAVAAQNDSIPSLPDDTIRPAKSSSPSPSEGLMRTSTPDDELRKALNKLIREQHAKEVGAPQEVDALIPFIYLHTQKQVLRAKIDEAKDTKNFIGDLHMERVGRPEMDATTEIRESERWFFNSMLNSRIVTLEAELKELEAKQ